MAKKKPKKKRTYRQQPKIRWTKSQVQRLKETVDAYNKNVRRVKRRKDVGQYAPPTEKFKELKMQISSANELNRIVKQLNKFAKIKGKPEMYTNPHGVTMTQWQRQKMRSALFRFPHMFLTLNLSQTQKTLLRHIRKSDATTLLFLT